MSLAAPERAVSSGTSSLPPGSSHHPLSVLWWLPPLQLVGFEPQCMSESRASSGSSARTNVLMGMSPGASVLGCPSGSLISQPIFSSLWGVFLLVPLAVHDCYLHAAPDSIFRVRISSLFLVSFPLAVRRPLQYEAPCTWTVAKAHRESV